MNFKPWVVIGLTVVLGLPLSQAKEAAPLRLRFVTAPFPPLMFFDERRQPTGPTVQLLQEACARLAWTCSVEMMPWRRALRTMELGAADGIFTISASADYARQLYVSVPVTASELEFFRQAGDSWVFHGDNRELVGRVLGVQEGTLAASVANAMIRDMRGSQLMAEADVRTVLRKLSAGRYGSRGLALLPARVARRIIAEEHLNSLEFAGAAQRSAGSFGLLRTRVSAQQAGQFDQVLYSLCKEGRTAELFKPQGIEPLACTHPS